MPSLLCSTPPTNECSSAAAPARGDITEKTFSIPNGRRDGTDFHSISFRHTCKKLSACAAKGLFLSLPAKIAYYTTLWLPRQPTPRQRLGFDSGIKLMKPRQARETRRRLGRDTKRADEACRCGPQTKLLLSSRLRAPPYPENPPA